LNTEQDLDVARRLARCGIPVFCAYQDANTTTGYRPPTGWQDTIGMGWDR